MVMPASEGFRVPLMEGGYALQSLPKLSLHEEALGKVKDLGGEAALALTLMRQALGPGAVRDFLTKNFVVVSRSSVIVHRVTGLNQDAALGKSSYFHLLSNQGERRMAKRVPQSERYDVEFLIGFRQRKSMEGWRHYYAFLDEREDDGNMPAIKVFAKIPDEASWRRCCILIKPPKLDTHIIDGVVSAALFLRDTPLYIEGA